MFEVAVAVPVTAAEPVANGFLKSSKPFAAAVAIDWPVLVWQLKVVPATSAVVSS